MLDKQVSLARTKQSAIVFLFGELQPRQQIADPFDRLFSDIAERGTAQVSQLVRRNPQPPSHLWDVEFPRLGELLILQRSAVVLHFRAAFQDGHLANRRPVDFGEVVP